MGSCARSACIFFSRASCLRCTGGREAGGGGCTPCLPVVLRDALGHAARGLPAACAASAQPATPGSSPRSTAGTPCTPPPPASAAGGANHVSPIQVRLAWGQCAQAGFGALVDCRRELQARCQSATANATPPPKIASSISSHLLARHARRRRCRHAPRVAHARQPAVDRARRGAQPLLVHHLAGRAAVEQVKGQSMVC